VQKKDNAIPAGVYIELSRNAGMKINNNNNNNSLQ